MSPEEKPPEAAGAAGPLPAARTGWRGWLQLAAAAVLLLALSEALWLWQTWPVRELLYAAPARTTGGR